MALFSRKKPKIAPLSREESLSTRPVLNPVVRLEKAGDGNVVLQVPRRQTALVRTVSRFYRMPPYRKVALDELGTFVIELCNGKHTVGQIVDKFCERFDCRYRRDAEESVAAFLRKLATRSVVGLVVEARDERAP